MRFHWIPNDVIFAIVLHRLNEFVEIAQLDYILMKKKTELKRLYTIFAKYENSIRKSHRNLSIPNRAFNIKSLPKKQKNNNKMFPFILIVIQFIYYQQLFAIKHMKSFINIPTSYTPH